MISTRHAIRTTHLTAFDTKRLMCEDTVHTHSHGHSEYMELVNTCWVAECL